MRPANLSRRRAWAGAVTLAACLGYFVTEAIAASAWRDPPYSYVRNYISDLGITDCVRLPGGPAACSSLAAVMNTGLLVAGLLPIAAALCLAPLIAAPRARRAVIAFAALHGCGSALVGLVHSAPGSAAGTPLLHFAAAYLAIVSGNLLVLTAGLAARRNGAPPWYVLLSVVLAVTGIAAGGTLLTTAGVPAGLFERLAANAVTVWEGLTGVVLAAALLRWRGHAVSLADLAGPQLPATPPVGA